ncbi:SDR family NAD(P)-dependent oxidoreductase [Marinobacter zhanjiangensis]|uniref:Short-chain dehydrogenase n=1 Tax=Marinobacter zhanjiangensis TaxID=578215 RepID=A0ABQ3B692_9GAMM|nr:SDR family NAD(P)-dependent oxidoreductase [Marinobacter zhanjiangensis]GGY81822.1 short-chain dehydrogenase [Marinobacter zhanjiangensis]
MSHFLDQPSTIWLTGATSGIGECLAYQLIGDGHSLVVTGRRQQALDELVQRAPERVTAAAADTTDTDQVRHAASALDEVDPVDVAILNAGTCEYLDIRQFDSELIGRNIDTNVMGTVRCIEQALPRLRRTRRLGKPAALVIVGSSAWWFPFTRAEGYGASKAALAYLAQSLRADLAREGIEVFLVSPGFVKTPLTDQNDFPMPFLIQPEDAANRIIKGLKKGRHNIEFPKRFTWTIRLLGNLPQGLIDRMAARMARESSEENRST